MAGFTMCPACQAEYDDPGDRRFHAQPNACAGCGPRLRWLDAGRQPVAVGAGRARRGRGPLLAGRHPGGQGLGGYHLAVDATDAAAVAELRRRKAARRQAVRGHGGRRGRRPGRLCRARRRAEAALTSPRRPIVLAPAGLTRRSPTASRPACPSWA